MNIKYLVLILVFTVTSFSQEYNFTNYSVIEGLAQSEVFDIFQDNNGYLWLGTWGGGISKFDGKNFETIINVPGLADNSITAITSDHTGNIWIGTISKGISVLDGLKFKNYSVKDGLCPGWVNNILIDKNNNVWICTNNGLSFFNGNTFKNFSIKNGLPDNYIYCAWKDEKDNIWFGTAHGIAYYSDNKIRKEPYGLNILNHKSITAISSDNENNLWFGTKSGELYKYANKKIHRVLYPGYKKGNSILSILKDSKGNIWFGTKLTGVIKFNKNNFSTYSTKNGMSNNHINKIFEDREGNIWFGTMGGGIIKLGRFPFKHFNIQDGLSDKIVFSIMQDQNGNYWFGTQSGLINKFDGNKISVINFSKKFLQGSDIRNLFKDKKNNIWISTGTGLWRYNSKYLVNFSDQYKLPGKIFSLTFQDHNNNLWFSSLRKGIIKFDGKKIQVFTNQTGLISNSVYAIYEDNYKNIWFGTEAGLSIYNGKTFKNFDKGVFNKGIIFSILGDSSNNIFVSTYGGGIIILRYDGREVLKTVDTITAKDGLTNNQVYSMIIDKGGNLWAGTIRGINKINLKEYYKTGKKIIKQYDNEEGFKNLECNNNAIWKDDNGNIWFGTINGVTIYNPAEEITNKTGPITNITGIKIFYKSVLDKAEYYDSLDPATALPVNLKLPYAQNHITISYNGISLSSPAKVKYKYILHGFDKNWSPLTKERFATYSNLPPGRYTFEVKSVNADGIPNMHNKIFNFIIEPPFWQTWWFIISSFILLFSAILITYRINLKAKIRKAVETEKIKNNISEYLRIKTASDFHDEIGHRLTRITLLSDMIMKGIKTQTNSVEPLLLKLSDNARQVFDETRDLIWAIDPKNDTLYALFIRLKDFGDDLFGLTEVKFKTSTIDPELKSVIIETDWRRQVTLIFKEAINNILKHSKCKNVYLEWMLSGNKITISISDDGVGFRREYLPETNGFNNMKMRSEKINANLDIVSGIGNGTKIILNCYIPGKFRQAV